MDYLEILFKDGKNNVLQVDMPTMEILTGRISDYNLSDVKDYLKDFFKNPGRSNYLFNSDSDKSSFKKSKYDEFIIDNTKLNKLSEDLIQIRNELSSIGVFIEVKDERQDKSIELPFSKEIEAEELFIAANKYDNDTLDWKLKDSNMNFLMPDHMLNNFDNVKRSLLEHSIYTKNDYLAELLLNKDVNIEPYEILNKKTGLIRKHDPFSAAIMNGNDYAFSMLMYKSPDSLTKDHVILLNKRYELGNLGYVSTYNFGTSMEPICEKNGIVKPDIIFEKEMDKEHKKYNDHFQDFMYQIKNDIRANKNIEHKQSEHIPEYLLEIKNPHTQELLYEGKFSYGRKTGYHIHYNQDKFFIEKFDKGKAFVVDNDIKLFQAVLNKDMDELKYLVKDQKLEINCITPNIIASKSNEKYKFSLIETAIRTKNTEAVSFMIKNEVDLKPYEIKNSINGEIKVHDPVMTAVYNKDHGTLKEMFSHDPSLLTKETIANINTLATSNKDWLKENDYEVLTQLIEPIAKENNLHMPMMLGGKGMSK